jgi:hypothetical protein
MHDVLYPLYLHISSYLRAEEGVLAPNDVLSMEGCREGAGILPNIYRNIGMVQ